MRKAGYECFIVWCLHPTSNYEKRGVRSQQESEHALFPIFFLEMRKTGYEYFIEWCLQPTLNYKKRGVRSQQESEHDLFSYNSWQEGRKGESKDSGAVDADQLKPIQIKWFNNWLIKYMPVEARQGQMRPDEARSGNICWDIPSILIFNRYCYYSECSLLMRHCSKMDFQYKLNKQKC